MHYQRWLRTGHPLDVRPRPRNTGKTHGRAVLTEQDVIDMRRSKASGTALAKQYDVSVSTVYKILSGETWTHVTPKRRR